MANERMELRALMKTLNLSGSALARWVRKRPQTISAQLTGGTKRMDPVLLELLRLAVSVEKLLEGKLPWRK